MVELGTELLYVYVVWLWRKSGVYTLHVSGGTDLSLGQSSFMCMCVFVEKWTTCKWRN